MKRRSFPLWLLRDAPAFLGVMFSFWPLMILVIVNGRRAASGKTVRQSTYEDFAILLSHAEARLAFALWRQAYRRLGWNPRGVIFNLIPATDNFDDTIARYHAYSRACREMDAYVDAYVEDLREQYNISKTDLVAHGSTDARLSRAAHHELVGAAPYQRSPFALTLSSAQSARPSKGERGSLSCRGPPFATHNSLFALSHLARPARENAPLCPYTDEPAPHHISAPLATSGPYSRSARSGTGCASPALGLLNML